MINFPFLFLVIFDIIIPCNSMMKLILMTTTHIHKLYMYIIMVTITDTTVSFTHTSSTDLTEAYQGRTEGGIEPVLVILWGSGAVLLITLVILLVCILRSQRKGRNNRYNCLNNLITVKPSQNLLMKTI